MAYTQQTQFPKACNKMSNDSYNIYPVNCQRLFHYWEWRSKLMTMSRSSPTCSLVLGTQSQSWPQYLVLAKKAHWYQYYAYHPSSYSYPKLTLPDLPHHLELKKSTFNLLLQCLSSCRSNNHYHSAT